MKTLLAFLMLVTPTLADHCRVKNNAVVIQSTGAAIVPFAVPVATPVAVLSPYVYQHAGATAQNHIADASKMVADPEYAEFLAWKKSKSPQVAAAVAPRTLYQQNCVKCHAENADAKAHLDMSQPLDDAGKLAATKAILRGTMPKGKAIDDKTRGGLLGELFGVDGRSPYIPGTDASNE